MYRTKSLIFFSFILSKLAKLPKQYLRIAFIFPFMLTAKNVGKSTPANFPAFNLHGLTERFIIIIMYGFNTIEYFPDSCQPEKYVNSAKHELCANKYANKRTETSVLLYLIVYIFEFERQLYYNKEMGILIYWFYKNRNRKCDSSKTARR